MKLVMSLPTAPNASPLSFEPLSPESRPFRILFVYPNMRLANYPLEAIRMPHLGLAVLSSCVRQIGAEPSLCDLTTVFPGMWMSVFQAQMQRVQPHLVAFTATSMQWPVVVPLLRACRERGFSYVVGGPHATDHPDGAMQETDLLVTGEGEGALLDIIRALSRRQKLAGIANTWVRDERGSIIRTDKRHLIEELDELPFPDWKLFGDFQYYPQLNWGPLAQQGPVPIGLRVTIEGSRGCPFQCTYCTNTGHMAEHRGKGRWRREKSPRRIIEELQSFEAVYGKIQRVQWVDEVFITRRERTHEFAERYRQSIGAPFTILERPENVTDDSMQQLANAGLMMICIGLESGDPKIREALLNRKTRTEVLERAFTVPRKYGIKTYAFTMVGLPGQDEESMLKTWRFFRKVQPDAAQFTVFRPMRGTPLYDECVQRGLHDPQNDTTIWQAIPIIRHDCLDNHTILRYQLMLSEYATQRGIWPGLAFHIGRKYNWACRVLLRSQRRWRTNHQTGRRGLRNLLDILRYEWQHRGERNDPLPPMVELVC
ncbi:MAG: Anaerobic magnesium-protoporphyrin IX monomethyl ester cyclase [Phycisphaerae bacterium]|nr:Anaerobic magnesium-protoporphyrin IX monomethyl ester cyclase [Phycisphaerae bacterium]